MTKYTKLTVVAIFCVAFTQISVNKYGSVSGADLAHSASQAWDAIK